MIILIDEWYTWTITLICYAELLEQKDKNKENSAYNRDFWCYLH